MTRDLGLLLDTARERDIAFLLGDGEIAPELLLDVAGELHIPAHREQHAVVCAKALHLASHIRTVGAEPPTLVHEAVPDVYIFRAIDEGLLAIDLVHGLGIFALRRAAHDGKSDPID